LKSQNKLEEGSCLLCGNLSTLEVHHKDGDRTNDAESNLTSLCHPCHSKLHQRGANFWNGNRADNKRSYAELNHNGAKVLKVARVSRDPKINWKANGMTSDLPVFNISCAPHNTYLLNTMWVHNCDTKYSWPLNQGAQLSPLEVLSKIRDIGGDCRKVTITGGEPLEQDGKEFMDLLILLTSVGYSVTIETAGVVSFAHLKDIPSVSLVVDLKTPSALPTGNKLVYSPLTEEMSLLSDRHFIKCVISSLDDFNWALGWVNILRGSGCRARIFFSPDHTAMTGVQLFEYIKASSLCQKFNVGLNLQLHKYLFPADYREEEYLNTGKGNESHENSSHGS
jgi:organic radical activating enzyme